MATSPSNPGIIILLLLGLAILIPSTFAAIDDSIYHNDPSFLLGIAAGLVAGGIAFSALRAPAEMRVIPWVAFFTSLPAMFFLILQATGSDDVGGGMALAIIASWLMMPFAIAVAHKGDASGPPSRE